MAVQLPGWLRGDQAQALFPRIEVSSAPRDGRSKEAVALLPGVRPITTIFPVPSDARRTTSGSIWRQVTCKACVDRYSQWACRC